MKTVIILIWLCYLIDSLIPSSYSAELIELVGLGGTLPRVSSQSQTFTEEASGNRGFGFGIFLVGELLPPYSLEIGGLFRQRHFTTNVQTGEKTTYQLKLLEVPILIRYRIYPNISVGGGIYTSMSLGTLTSEVNSSSGKIGYDQAQLETRDFGLATSIRFRKHLHEVIHFVADGRILYSLRNLSTNAQNTIRLADIEILAGISFGL